MSTRVSAPGASGPLLARVLEVPSYGYEADGKLVVPSHAALWREFFRRLNVLHDRRYWVALFCWVATLAFAIPLVLFIGWNFRVA